MVIPITYLHTAFVNTYCFLNEPLIFITDGRGGSDARANAANTSIIKLSQKSYVAVSGVS
jgi:hypothetical protein